MRRHTRSITLATIVATIVVCALAGCSKPPTAKNSSDRAAETGALAVYVVNYPLAYFAERIGGDRVDIAFPAPPDEDPAFWTPGAEVIVRYQQADLILLNGASYFHPVATHRRSATT